VWKATSVFVTTGTRELPTNELPPMTQVDYMEIEEPTVAPLPFVAITKSTHGYGTKRSRKQFTGVRNLR
jgi:hypothetical protein